MIHRSRIRAFARTRIRARIRARIRPRGTTTVAGVVGVGRARARGLDKTRAMVFISWVYISLNT